MNISHGHSCRRNDNRTIGDFAIIHFLTKILTYEAVDVLHVKRLPLSIPKWWINLISQNNKVFHI